MVKPHSGIRPCPVPPVFWAVTWECRRCLLTRLASKRRELGYRQQLADSDPTGYRVANKPAYCAAAFEAKPTSTFVRMTLDANRTALTPKPAFSSLDRVFFVPTATLAVRSGLLFYCVAGSAGFQVLPNQASADNYVWFDFLDLPFYFSFACLSAIGEFLQSVQPV